MAQTDTNICPTADQIKKLKEISIVKSTGNEIVKK